MVLASCNQLYGLEPTISVDARDIDSMLPDEDGDGTPDVTDNCPHIANDQADEDQDLIGDACDNCPLFANATQDDFENDGIGDACDPQPTQALDCLVVFDTFRDPGAFAQHWKLLKASGSPATAEPAAGHVTLHPMVNQDFAMIALDGDGKPLLGTFDVEVIGHADLTTGTAWVGSRIVALGSGYWGGLIGHAPRDRVSLEFAGATGALVLYRDLPTARVGNSYAMRMFVDDPGALQPTMYVRVDYGVAVGTMAETSDRDVPVTGSPGLVVKLDDIDVDAFAVYRRQPPPCPPPLLR